MRRLLTAGLALAAGAGIVAGPASAASLQLDLKCKYPVVGDIRLLPVKLTVAGDFPTSQGAGIPAVPLTVTLDSPDSGIKTFIADPTTRIVGSFKLGMAIGTDGLALPVDVPGTFAGDVRGIFAAYSLKGQATIPSTPGGRQPVNYDVVSFSASLKHFDAAGEVVSYPPLTTDIDGNPITDSDGDPTTLDISCKVDPPTQSKRLASVVPLAVCPPAIFAPAPPIAEALTDTDVSSTSVRLHWGASIDDPNDCLPAAVSYKVTYGDKSVTVPATQLETTISGLSPSTAYAFKIEALGAIPGVGGGPITVSVTTKASGTTQPLYQFALAGSTSLKTLTKGTLPLKGSIAANLQLATGLFTADLALDQTQGRLVALGFLPVTAKIGFVTSGKTTGLLHDGVLTTNSKVRIKVQEVKLFGAIPLAGGNNCQTKSLSDINLKSTQPEFSPVVGGPIAGTFAISDLNGCGALNGLVSPLTAGGGNTINLNLTPKA